jgi:hypothetical protein
VKSAVSFLPRAGSLALISEAISLCYFVFVYVRESTNICMLVSELCVWGERRELNIVSAWIFRSLRRWVTFFLFGGRTNKQSTLLGTNKERPWYSQILLVCLFSLGTPLVFCVLIRATLLPSHEGTFKKQAI